MTAFSKPDISLFFPAYNEADNIASMIKKAQKVLSTLARKWEILVVVYEGSTDRTKMIVKKNAKEHHLIKLVIQPMRQVGYGTALKIGFQRARYPWIFFSDADNQFDLRELKNLLALRNQAQAIVGYRIKRADPWIRILATRIYNLVNRLVFGTKVRDVDCAFKLVKKTIFKDLNLICKTGLVNTELLVKATKKGYKIKEVGVTHFPRTKGQSAFESRNKFFHLVQPKVIWNLGKEILILYWHLKKEFQ